MRLTTVAVQILPLAEFQIGLAKFALRSNHLLSSEVLGSIRQPLQCAPWYPESHNLNGLVSEARHDYQSAISSYQLACYAWNNSTFFLLLYHYVDISINLAWALCKVFLTSKAFKFMIYHNGNLAKIICSYLLLKVWLHVFPP